MLRRIVVCTWPIFPLAVSVTDLLEGSVDENGMLDDVVIPKLSDNDSEVCWVVGGMCSVPLFYIHSRKNKEHSGTYGQMWTLIARDNLPIMASSVSSEWPFSSAGITISKQHNWLKPDIVEALQCLKCLYKNDFIFRDMLLSSTVEKNLDGRRFWI